MSMIAQLLRRGHSQARLVKVLKAQKEALAARLETAENFVTASRARIVILEDKAEQAKTILQDHAQRIKTLEDAG